MNKVSKDNFTQEKYKYGFVTEIESEKIPKGLNEDVIKLISKKKNEPDWMLDWRLSAFKRLENMSVPKWAKAEIDEIDFQDLYYYSSPKDFKEKPKSLDEVDPKLLETYEKLGIPLKEQKVLAGVAVDAVFDSVSVATTFKEKLNEIGVIFCPISEAIQKHPELVKKYISLGFEVCLIENYGSHLGIKDEQFEEVGVNISKDESEILKDHQNPDIAYNQLIRPRKNYLALTYIKNKSITLDLKIIFLTFFSFFNKRKTLNLIVRILRNYNTNQEIIEMARRNNKLTPMAPPGLKDIVYSREKDNQN